MSETIDIESVGTIISSLSKRITQLESRALYSKVPLKPAKLTTTERDALNAVNGDFIYNTTNNRFEGYENGTWVDL